MKKDDEFLIKAAIKAREAAYCEYSKFAVGAALLTKSGEVFSGCNIENLSYGLTICAERVAVGSAIAAGHRSFDCIAVSADTREPISPCGACRQVLAEFGECRILLVNLKGDILETTIAEMLPRSATGILDRD